MVKKAFTIIVLLLICELTVSSQTLHALLFVNEQEQGRQKDRQADMDNMTVFWRNVAKGIGYTCSLQKCSPSTFTADNVNKFIDNLIVDKNDIVVFYYSGHGYNDETDIWPSLNFLDQNYRQIDIVKKLKKVSSPAKLILCIADCCNKQANFSYDLTSTYDSFEDYSGLKKLFLGYKGRKSILMSASKQGQFSWSNLNAGAYFGICLRRVLSNLNMNDITWDIVLQKVSDLTYKYTDGRQTPQYNIIQSGDPFE